MQLEIDELKEDAPQHTRRVGDKPHQQLHQKIVDHFNLQELHNFMYDLGVNPENLEPYAPKPDQALQFVLYMKRHGEIDKLISGLEQIRSKVKWR